MISTITTSKNNNIIIFFILLLSFFGATLLFSQDILIATAVFAVLSLSLIFIVKPVWLFYFFMVFFVFSEVSFGNLFIELSLSNYFSVMALVIAFIYGLSRKNFSKNLATRRILLFIVLFGTLFLVEILSAIANDAFRPLTTRISHLASILYIFLLVSNRSVIHKGIILGILSIGILSILTILAGLDLNPFGYRAAISWGSTPWEGFIHRSIGLANMQGGLHSIYIISFLPFAISFMINRKNLQINRVAFLFLGFISIVGVLALMIASYRSGWLGLAMSIICIFIFLFNSPKLSINTKVLFSSVIIIFIVFLTIFQRQQILDQFYKVFFDVRNQGIEARLIQYSYVIQEMLYPSINIIYGFGYEKFGNSFMAYVAQEGINNPELFPWLHNYFLGLLFASGWLGFLIFLIISWLIFRTLYLKIREKNGYDRAFSVANFSSLAGIYIVLLFTAEISGLQIMWILMAFAIQGMKKSRKEII
jgi:hypothetical protein